ncbi:uncharacterized protein L203_102304 [Cryptococcus depauperatus CBS 7841]|uniref:Uncharacterized protein n=1 Tax=Cryptococcus depauperatus CBS 7841 TaxID=1295531 RepID=A0A1E3IA94_9TREE|nr:hypothetical protein L203_04761 [Cryptococcus depauperatus CBS 7841]
MSLKTSFNLCKAIKRPATTVIGSTSHRSIITSRPAITRAIPKQYRMSSVLSATASAAHSAFASLASVAQAKPGSSIPNVEAKIDSPDGRVNFSKLTGKNLLVVVPGAFTPVCSNQVPGYIEQYEKFKSKGVKDIYVVSVNDIYVVNAWKKDLKGDQLKFVADDSASLAAALGLTLDGQAVLGGPRFKRGALILNDGKVEWIGIEDSPLDLKVSKAENVLAQL